MSVSVLSAQSGSTEAPAGEAISVEAAAASVREAFAYISETLVSIDLGLLAQDPDQMRIVLPDGRVYVAVRSASWTEEGDRRYWTGELHPDGSPQKEAEGTLSLSVEGGIVAGSLRAGVLAFEIVPLAEGRQQLVPAASRATGGKGAHCEALATASEGEPHEPLPIVTADALNPASVVDVLVVFPRSLAANATQLMQTRAKIILGFGDANQVLANSGVSHRFRMVYGGPLYGAQPPVAASAAQANSILGAQWLIEGQSEVVALRDSWQADLVALFVPQDSNLNCGAAQGSNPTTHEYAAIDIGCASGEYLVAHELGHLLGMRHAAGESGSSPSPYAFGFGYDNNNLLMVNGQRAATVMACNGNNNGEANPTNTGIQCNRIPYYSSPDLSVGGSVLGNATANNAEVARQQMYLTSQRRASLATGNLPPRVTIVRPQGSRAQSGQSITFSARAFDSEDGNRDANVQWSSNRRGYLGTGATLRVYSSLLGSEIITASVADSGGLTHARSISLYFESLVVTEGAIWHDPNFPGRFLSFNKNVHNGWIATWMAYEGSSPIWYLTGVGPMAANGSFSGLLQRFTRNIATGQQTASSYGSLSISVETERQVRLTITPVAGTIASTPVDLVLEPYTRASGPGGYWSLARGQVDPGWVIYRGPTAFGSAGQEARIVATFDGAQPVWVLGLGSRGGFPGQPFGLLMYRPTPASMTDNFKLPGSSSIGNLVFTDQGTAWTTLTFPSGNTWIRPEQPVEAFVIR